MNRSDFVDEMAQSERAWAVEAMTRGGFVVRAAAGLVGMSASAFSALLKRHGLEDMIRAPGRPRLSVHSDS